jgi:cyclase
MSYVKGLQEVGDGLYAYLQPDGGWGWSNAGLVVDGERTLLVDTLYDLALTEQALSPLTAFEQMAELARARAEDGRAEG